MRKKAKNGLSFVQMSRKGLKGARYHRGESYRNSKGTSNARHVRLRFRKSKHAFGQVARNVIAISMSDSTRGGTYTFQCSSIVVTIHLTI